MLASTGCKAFIEEPAAMLIATGAILQEGRVVVGWVIRA